MKVNGSVGRNRREVLNAGSGSLAAVSAGGALTGTEVDMARKLAKAANIQPQ